MARQNQTTVYVKIGGRDRGLWAVATGGGITADNTRYNPGGMLPPLSLGGYPETDDVTLRKLHDDVTHADLADMISRVGDPINGDSVVTRLRNTGPNKSVNGRALAYRGVLTAVNPPDSDASSNDAAELEIVISPSAPPTLA